MYKSGIYLTINVAIVATNGHQNKLKIGNRIFDQIEPLGDHNTKNKLLICCVS